MTALIPTCTILLHNQLEETKKKQVNSMTHSSAGVSQFAVSGNIVAATQLSIQSEGEKEETYPNDDIYLL